MSLKIVFVHLLSRPPLHLLMNIKRCTRLFQEHKTVLIQDQNSWLTSFVNNRFIIDFDSIDQRVEEMYGFPRDFRNNFWFSSVARFSSIEKYMKINDGPILHIESDVILSPDFPIDKFRFVKQSFAFPIVSERRAIASSLYVKDAKAANFLWKFTCKIIEENPLASDMEILYQLSKTYPEMVLRLPIAPNSLMKKSISLEEVNEFDGVFDGHDFGVYLAGTNPWNLKGVSHLHEKIPESLLNFSSSNLFYDKKRRFVSIVDFSSQELVNLYSLHITNKNPLFFGEHSASSTLKFWLNYMKGRDTSFHFLVWLIMGVRFLRKKFRSRYSSLQSRLFGS